MAESAGRGVEPSDIVRDSVDDILRAWARERPDLDFSPIGVVTRLGRLRSTFDRELAAVFSRFDLTPADFVVLVTLRRAGQPYCMAQARLMDALGLTSGTVSVRLERLDRLGLITRKSDDANARASLVSLTASGLDLFDELAPVHLHNEHRLLAALTEPEQRQLADLLRRLLVSFESPASDVAAALGLTVEAAHVARQKRQAVGLSDTAGLLVSAVEPGAPADMAGVHRGDLLTAANGTPTVSYADLATVLAAAVQTKKPLTLTVLRGDFQLEVQVEPPS